MTFLEDFQNAVDLFSPYEDANEIHISSSDYYSDLYSSASAAGNDNPPYNYHYHVLRSSGSAISKLNPWWVTGFVDAEGSFGINITNNESVFKTGLQFKVSQNAPNKTVLESLVDYFGTGKVNVDKASTNTIKFQVQDLVSIREKVSLHFDKYPLVTSKVLDYNDWQKAMDILVNKEHLTVEGKDSLIEIKNKMNNLRTKQERWEYLNSINNFTVPDPNWLRGFLDGEASFQFQIGERATRNTSYIIANPTMEIAQSNHDVAVLKIIKDHLESGYLKPKFDTSSLEKTMNSRDTSRFVTNDEDKVREFVDKYPLLTSKQLDYLDWKKLIDMKEQNLHKTDEGYSSIMKIKSGMNQGRKFHL